METLSTKISRPMFLDSSLLFQSSSSCKSSTSLLGFSKITPRNHCLSNRCLKAPLGSGLQSNAHIFRIRALGDQNDPVAEKGEQEKRPDLGSEDASSMEDGDGRTSSAEGCDDNLMISPVMVGISGGSRAIRTPVSGGVQSATSAHDLPRPALAVRNLMEQVPGWSGVTIFGKVYPLTTDKQEWAHKHYIAKHQQGKTQQWGNFYYYRMESISDIYFIGGFGTVAWVDVNEYETVQPDKIAVNGGERHLKELNTMFSKRLKDLLSEEAEIDDAALISIDSKGADIRVRQGTQFNIQRIPFHAGHKVETLEEAKAALQKLVNKASKLHFF